MADVRAAAVALLMLAALACSDSDIVTSIGPPTTQPLPPTATGQVTTAPPASATTTVAATTTSTLAQTTTTTPTRPEQWLVTGRRYYFPIQPPDVTSYSATHHDYPATDIFGPEGSFVVAIADGVIDEVSRTDVWDRAVNDPATRGGLYVSLLGDDGVRYYYSHLLAVAPRLDAGVRVYAGQLVGALGRTGNAAATSPHVHFGISPPTFAGDWEVRRGVLPPFELLQAWTAGVDETPELP